MRALIQSATFISTDSVTRNSSALGLQIASASVMAACFYGVLLLPVYFSSKRRDWISVQMFWIFSAFLLSSGTVQLLEIWNSWHMTQPLLQAAQAVTAGVMLLAATLLAPLTVKAMASPSPAQLRQTNLHLENQILDYQRAKYKLQAANQAAEERVLQCTAQLRDLQERLYFSDERFRILLAALKNHAVSTRSDMWIAGMLEPSNCRATPRKRF